MKTQTQTQQQGPPGYIKKYIFHFDLNKTIIMLDQSGQMSKELTLMDMLVAFAWGRIDEKNPNIWKLAHNQFIKNPPAGQSGLISYKQFCSQLIPYKTEKEIPNEEERKVFYHTIIFQIHFQFNRKQRQELYLNFAKPNGPGVKMKNDLDKLMKHLILPRVVQDELKIGTLTEEELKSQVQKNPLLDNFKDGQYYIMPYFYKLIMSLKKVKKEFAIVFRSFNKDVLDKTIIEFNKFCQGEHPCYSGKNGLQLARFDGSKNTKNYVISNKHRAMIFRIGPDSDDITGVFGSFNRKEINLKEGGFEAAYQQDIEEDIVTIEYEGQNIYARMMEMLKTSCAFAILDDYSSFHQHQQKTQYAKPLLIDQYDYSTLQIFFDDEIETNPEQEEKNVIEVQDVILNQKLNLKKSINKYLVKVDPIQVLRDPDFFIKIIESCEKLRIDEIEKIEKGVNMESEESLEQAPKKSQWELQQELPDTEYLRKTVMPLLHPALKIIDIERPLDPISFIAIYMLKNKDRAKLPQPDIQEKEYVEEVKEVDINQENEGKQKQENQKQQPDQQKKVQIQQQQKK